MIDFNIEINCPNCNRTVKIDCGDYKSVLSSSDKDNGMGLDTQWGIEGEVVCPSCRRKFIVEGTIGEYPADTIEFIDIKTRKL